MTFVVTIAIFVIVLLALSMPAILTARSHNRPRVAILFAAAAITVGTTFGFLDARYQRNYDICIEEGRSGCEAIGFTGLQLLLVVGFLIASMVTTYKIFND